MKIKLALFLSLIFCISIYGQVAKNIASLTTDQWREDILFLKEQIEQKHIDAFHFQSKEAWDKKFGAFEKALPKLSYEQKLVGIATLGASFGDGHTAARPYEFMQRFPVTFSWFGNDLRIVRIDKHHQAVVGSKVLKIGKMSVADAYHKVLPLIPAHESPTFLLGWSEHLLRFEEVLVGTGIKKPGNLTLQVQDDVGTKTTVTLTLEPSNQSRERVWAYHPLPLYLSKPEKSPYYEWIPDTDSVLYFNFERYMDWKEFRDFGMGFIKFIQSHQVKELIVDMRENGGGDFKQGLRLIEELKKTYLNSPGKIFVIIGRNTFSAGMSNAAQFKTMLNATLVGETTGARPVGYQENLSFTLPNSGIPGSCSIKKYEFLTTDTDGIIPDKEILPDFYKYKEGKDAAIEWILKQP